MIGGLGGKKILPTRGLPTPFGEINLPSMEFPVLKPPELDERRRRAVKHAVATDLTGIIGVVPYVGSLLAGQISDLHYAEMRKILTPGELEKYIIADKKIPSNGLALLYSFVRGGITNG